jgi:predicted RNA binding protein YcfA (HicA-like mRNA interferase family)
MDASAERKTVTVAGHDGAEVAPKTLRSIERQAGWR